MKAKIIVIVGPTASGKTSLSIAIAKHFNGEVISADARQVYRGLDIGSGKVTKAEMAGIPHHLLDITDPMSVYTAADFKRDGERVIEDIIARGQVPIIAGGTFFYVDTLLGRMSLPPVPPNKALREKLEVLDTGTLFAMLKEKDPRRATTIDKDNKVRLVRALEIVDALGTVPAVSEDEPYEVFMIGIEIEKETLHKNIKKRLYTRLEDGMIEEVQRLHDEGVSWERLHALGLEYRYVSAYLQEKMAKEEMLEKLETEIRHFAKRQMTWLKRDKTIHWYKPEDGEKMFEGIALFLKDTH